MIIERAIAALTTGMTNYAIYWAILVTVASLEMLAPGRPDRLPRSPRFKVNFAFGLMTMAMMSFPLLSEVTLARVAVNRSWGLMHHTSITLPWQIGISFLVYDLFGYAIHRMSHIYGWLWRLHRVHHADGDLDLSTYFRSHPLDLVLVLTIRCGLIVALGLHPAALLLHVLAKQLTMAFGHANLVPRPRLSRAVAIVFVTPAFHAIHHSASQPETDSNFGEVLTIWDRLLGSLRRVSGPVERFGLGDAYDADSASLLSQLKLPFVRR